MPMSRSDITNTGVCSRSAGSDPVAAMQKRGLKVIPLDATLVKGSHGLATGPTHGPLLMTSQPTLLEADQINPTNVSDLLLRHLTR
mgnify:CR=1 FL=1